MNDQVFSHADNDGDRVRLNKPSSGDPTGTVGFIIGGGAYVDRAAAVGLITALTDLVESYDTEEAKKAAEAAAKEAAKLKAGDKVLTYTYPRDTLFLVITDESANGRVDLVRLRDGVIYRNRLARSFTRRASAGGWVGARPTISSYPF
ncbi:hypothetical protein HPO96_37185 [Kribbella sandramycini]|uniref:Uncharacterized protein n=1 Tax=Kribbella sandramycini TaxID=60450 RepID=A0A7Y4L7M1_9ACTN|nr:hypothetical protein [Kribbella sandramycini]MBB6564437.1 hypothetical protein [Kribbella sandramycini]NOL45895.1 hypothetical protein [Kribbella sandramycini]